MVDAHIFSSSGYLFQVLLHLDVQKTLKKFLAQISRGQTSLVAHCGSPWAGPDWANRKNARSFALEYQNTPLLVFIFLGCSLRVKIVEAFDDCV